MGSGKKTYMGNQKVRVVPPEQMPRISRVYNHYYHFKHKICIIHAKKQYNCTVKKINCSLVRTYVKISLLSVGVEIARKILQI